MRTLWYVLVWNAILAGSLFVVYLVIMIIIAIGVVLFVKDSLVLVMFIAILGKVNFLVMIALLYIEVLANVALIAAIYYRYKKENGEDVYVDALRSKEYREKKNKTKRLLGVLFTMVVVVNSIYFYNVTSLRYRPMS